MDHLTFELSDNLYYADQLGSVSDQIDFLDNLHISEPVLSVDSSFNETLLFISTYVNESHIYSRMCVLKPSLRSHIRTFNHSKVLDIRRYLSDRGFKVIINQIHFKKLDYET